MNNNKDTLVSFLQATNKKNILVQTLGKNPRNYIWHNNGSQEYGFSDGLSGFETLQQ